ncbi:MAG: DUF2750 domain-containing protein [Kofleriaceae bacterium]
MSWTLGDEELHRVLALSVKARYAYAINKIREHGELWTLRSEGGWVVSCNPAGEKGIPIWPHERLARLEAVELWDDAEPSRISLEDWLSDSRAALFEENDLHVDVFLVGPSSMATDYSRFTELLRGPERPRYQTGSRSSGKARDPKRATRATQDLVSYLNWREIDLVVERVPATYRERLRDTFQHRSSDAKELGAVSTRGRRDINLASVLPIRVSLGHYLHGGQSPEEFGAPKQGQWPPWAVRRFLLYDVLLHEIGHLQIVDPKASRVKRKFASETRAQELADELRRTLYSEPFDHPDPIHNAPTPGELATLDVWHRLDKAQRASLANAALDRQGTGDADLSLYEPLTDEQRAFLSRVLVALRSVR